MTVQIIEIAGQKMAMLPIADYQRLLDVVENKTDAVAALDAEQRRLAGEEYLPADLIDRILAGESPLHVWRKHRGMTLVQLGERAGCGSGHLSRIETGERGGTVDLWVKLADALNVSVEDLIPLI